MRILLVHVHPAAEGTTRRHYQYWQRAGYDRIVGITTEGGGCYWPNNDVAVIGPNRYIEGDHLCKRLIRTFEYGVNQGAHEIAIIEHDAVFFKPMPKDLPKGFVMNVTGGNIPPWKCTRFFHNVWHADRDTAKEVIALGDKLIAARDIEGGNPDLFLGYITDLLPHIPINQGLFKSYTQNALTNPNHLTEAREAYRNGATFCHGIKRQEELSFILS